MTPRGLAVATLAGAALALAGCAGNPKKDPPPTASAASPQAPAAAKGGRRVSPYAPAQEDPSTRGDYVAGGLYKPGVSDTTPTYIPDVDAIPEPEVVDEPRSRYGNRNPYVVLGKSYSVLDTPAGYREQGLASYYGQKFHGRKTSNHEVYDMYAFTAAHKSLPLPSFARVTNVDTGQSVVVRVNDRGPFHEGRVVDLSYAAAVKIGVHPRGTARVEVVGLSPGENARVDRDAVAAAPAAPAPAATRPAIDPATGLPPGVRVATGMPQPAPPSGIDRFVAALPIGAAHAGVRDPGAAALPSDPPAAAARTTPSSGAAATTAPAATATVPAPTAAPGGNGQEWRFDMAQGGRTMTADEFDAWMKSRRARVATGTAGTPDPHGSASPEARAAAAAAAAEAEKKLTWRERRALKRAEAERAKAAETATAAARVPAGGATPAPAATKAAAAGSAPAPTATTAATGTSAAPKPAAETAAAARAADTTPPPATAVAAARTGGGVTLQVAAFGARANAERALGMLRGAGIGDARVVDGTSSGKAVFRVRVGPVDAGRAQELGARVAGLGFGTPQVVRE